MSWHYSQALEEGSLEGSFAVTLLSELLKSNPIHGKSSSNDKGTESLIDSQSGTTLPRSESITQNAGSISKHSEKSETNLSSPEDSPVRTSAAQEKAQESKPTPAAGYGLSFPASSARYSRQESLWKIHPCLFPEDSISCSVILPKWGTMQDGELSAQRTPVLHTRENESGLWQTPVKDDAVNRKAGKYNSRGEPKLSAQVKLLPTPTKNCFQNPGEHGQGGQNLVTEVYRKPDGSVPTTGQLNPPWVEWLMGWPVGWTDLKPLGMDKFQQWLNSHGGN